MMLLWLLLLEVAAVVCISKLNPSDSSSLLRSLRLAVVRAAVVAAAAASLTPKLRRMVTRQVMLCTVKMSPAAWQTRALMDWQAYTVLIGTGSRRVKVL